MKTTSRHGFLWSAAAMLSTVRYGAEAFALGYMRGLIQAVSGE